MKGVVQTYNNICFSNKGMNSSENMFVEAGIQLQEQDVQVVLIDDEESFVQKYLDQGTLFDSRHSKQQDMPKFEPAGHKVSDALQPLQSKTKKQMCSSKNSIFHNFQKHLITIIKKLVHISELTFQGYECHSLASQLWTVFLQCKSQSKKIFHIIFGVGSQGRPDQELARLAEAYPQFKAAMGESSIKDIECAQEMIRIEVSSQMRRFSKLEVCARCRVHKGEQFYQYFRAFTHDLLEGQVAGRISKLQKEALIVKLYSQSKLV